MTTVLICEHLLLLPLSHQLEKAGDEGVMDLPTVSLVLSSDA